MYYRFLREVTSENPSLQIIIIAGNHDSAARLEAPNPLLEDMNVTVRGVVRRNAEGDIDLQHLIVPLYTEGEVTAYCLAVPYLRQGDYPSAENYSKGVQLLYEQLFNEVKEKGLPVIAMGHLQATGSEISEDDRSERTVIGGLECVSPDAFDELSPILHWGICIAPSVCPIGRMCVIPELLCPCLLLRGTMLREWS